MCVYGHASSFLHILTTRPSLHPRRSRLHRRSQQLEVLVLGLSSAGWTVVVVVEPEPVGGLASGRPAAVGDSTAGTVGLKTLASRSRSSWMRAACWALSVADRWAGRALKPTVNRSTRCSRLNICLSRSSLRSFSSDISSYMTLCICVERKRREMPLWWKVKWTERKRDRKGKAKMRSV